MMTHGSGHGAKIVARDCGQVHTQPEQQAPFVLRSMVLKRVLCSALLLKRLRHGTSALARDRWLVTETLLPLSRAVRKLLFLSFSLGIRSFGLRLALP
jgi:hypothetical protein